MMYRQKLNTHIDLLPGSSYTIKNTAIVDFHLQYKTQLEKLFPYISGWYSPFVKQ